MNRYVFNLLSVVVLALCACSPSATATPTTPPLDIQTVNGKVTQIVTKGSIQEFSLCILDAAVWGNYDTKLTVAKGYTQDSTPHEFTIKQGVFSDNAVENSPNSPAIFEGSGIVKIDDQQTAFDRGVPFFITDVTLEGASELNFTVVSNPKVNQSNVNPTIERISSSFYSTLTNPNNRLSSKAEPQHSTFSMSAAPTKGSYLSITKPISGTNQNCLLSNQYDLGSLSPAEAATPEATASATP